MRIQRTVFNVIARPAEEGGYWAEVVELPGCVTQGESKEELHRNVIEAIQACVAAYEEDGEYNEPEVELWAVPIFAQPEPGMEKVPV